MEIIHETLDDNGYCHSIDDQPAYILRAHNNTTTMWLKHGLLHRERGPASIIHYKHTIIEQTWYYDGRLHNNEPDQFGRLQPASNIRGRLKYHWYGFPCTETVERYQLIHGTTPTMTDIADLAEQERFLHNITMASANLGTEYGQHR